MIDLEEIEKAIEEHEQMRTSLQTCERLAWLYIVRDHLKATAQIDQTASYDNGHVSEFSESEFVKLFMQKSASKTLPVLDELMQTIQIVNPRLYAGTIQRIKNL